MFKDVEGEVVGAAKRPDREAEEKKDAPVRKFNQDERN